MRLSEANERTCRRCGRTFRLRDRNDPKVWCSKLCAKRDAADAKTTLRIANFLNGIDKDEDTVTIPLTLGLSTVIDVSDAKCVAPYEWHAIMRGRTWYARTNHREGNARRTLYLHQVILGERDGHEIDHIDGDGLNNRRSNLRFATRSQNRANQHRSKSGTKGVFWHSRDRKWQASLAGKHLGYFTDKAAAEAAYQQAAKAAYGEFACQT